MYFRYSQNNFLKAIYFSAKIPEMSFTEESTSNNTITSYSSSSFSVNHLPYPYSICLNKNIVETWNIDFQALDTETLKAAAKESKILVIGTGATRLNLAPKIIAELQNQGLGIELMNTEAACRTFNVLSSENREVTAILYISTKSVEL